MKMSWAAFRYYYNQIKKQEKEIRDVVQNCRDQQASWWVDWEPLRKVLEEKLNCQISTDENCRFKYVTIDDDVFLSLILTYSIDLKDSY
jgi:hypothetical protein